MLVPTRALSLVLSHCRRQAVEEVALAGATGRVLACPIRADRDSPPADRSAMDGYAVRADDLASVPRELKLVGEVAAGSSRRPTVRPGTCVRILTGANVPPGADAVAIVESTREAAPRVVRFHARVESGQHILRRGENTRKGKVLLEAGIRLGPAQIAVCAAVGADPVRVFVRPRVGVLCTGRELVPVSARVAAHVQRDSNGPALRAALEATGLARCVTVAVADDDPAELRRKMRAALRRCDVLLVVGGVSVGRYDFVPGVLDDLGCRRVFHGVKVKPGKPILFALGPGDEGARTKDKGRRTKDKGLENGGPLVFGLPGNPLSALTGFYEFVLPALKTMSGMSGEPLQKFPVRLKHAVTVKRIGRVYLHPAQLEFDRNGAAPLAIPVTTHSSADVVAGGQSDGVVVLPEEKTYEAGSLVEFHPWGTVP